MSIFGSTMCHLLTREVIRANTLRVGFPTVTTNSHRKQETIDFPCTIPCGSGHVGRCYVYRQIHGGARGCWGWGSGAHWIGDWDDDGITY